MSNEPITTNVVSLKTFGANEQDASAIESALVNNDLSKLLPSQRVILVKAVCDSLKVNYLTNPFGYIVFQGGKMSLYALKNCTDQLRAIHKVSVGLPERIDVPDCIAFRVLVTMPNGRTDSAIGAEYSKGKTGQDIANCIMKAETKTKRRATLSICGLGVPDESEIASIPGARIVDVNYVPPTESTPQPKSVTPQKAIEPPKQSIFKYDIEHIKQHEADWLTEQGAFLDDAGVWVSEKPLHEISPGLTKKLVPAEELPSVDIDALFGGDDVEDPRKVVTTKPSLDAIKEKIRAEKSGRAA